MAGVVPTPARSATASPAGVGTTPATPSENAWFQADFGFNPIRRRSEDSPRAESPRARSTSSRDAKARAPVISPRRPASASEDCGRRDTWVVALWRWGNYRPSCATYSSCGGGSSSSRRQSSIRSEAATPAAKAIIVPMPPGRFQDELSWRIPARVRRGAVRPSGAARRSRACWGRRRGRLEGQRRTNRGRRPTARRTGGGPRSDRRGARDR